MATNCEEICEALKEYNATAESVGLALRLNVAELVMRGMNRKGWNRFSLAHKADVSVQTIFQIVHSDANCTLDTIGRLFHALDVKAHIVEVK